ncbi:hypothetical protein GGS20DRAFT_350263 [Poronia punctata]|nr:hypothetical protein GGS20DRAFT_350263 [Poronia punctata]
MDPLTALSLAVNVVDLVDKAIKIIRTVAEVSNSVDGFSKDLRNIDREADNLNEIADSIRVSATNASYNAADKKIRQVSETILSQCQKLQSVLGDCKAKVKANKLEAALAVMKKWRKTGDIEVIQKSIESSRTDLTQWILLSIRTAMGEIENRNDHMTKTLSEVVVKLDFALGGPGDLAMNDAVKSISEVREAAKDRAVLELLGQAISYPRYDDVEAEEAGTFEWIFSEPERIFDGLCRPRMTFPGWLESGDGIFHVCGKPGAGKSTLMKFFCRHPKTEELLGKWAGDKELLFPKFFFWRLGTKDQKSISGLVRSLLHQILCSKPQLARQLFQPEVRSRIVRGYHKRSDAVLEPDQIMKAFSRLVEISMSPSERPDVSGMRICLFIDGLDEYDNTMHRQTYEELVNSLQTWVRGSNGNVKICVSSRPEAAFMETLDKSLRIMLHDLTRRDIRLFVEQRLRQHRVFLKYDAGKCEDLIDRIQESTQGVFLYVNILVKELEICLDDRCSISQLFTIVDQTPKGWDDFIESIVIGRISERLRKGTEALLAVLLLSMDVYHVDRYSRFAITPLMAWVILQATDRGLYVYEDASIGELEMEKEVWFKDGMNDVEIEGEICRIVETRCKGLVHAYNRGREGKRIGFMHRSVPECLEAYFSRRPGSDLEKIRQPVKVVLWAYLASRRLRRAGHGGLSCLAVRCVYPMRQESYQDGAELLTNLGAVRASFDRYTSTPFGLVAKRLEGLGPDDNLEDIFRLLMFIDQEAVEFGTCYPRPIDVCAQDGWHQFISWVCRKTKTMDDVNRRAGALFSSAYTQELEVMETVLDYSADVRAVFTASFPDPLAGIPLWHFICWHWVRITQYWGATKFRYLGSILELCLRRGANPSVVLHFPPHHPNVYIPVLDDLGSDESALDNSSFINFALPKCFWVTKSDGVSDGLPLLDDMEKPNPSGLDRLLRGDSIYDWNKAAAMKKGFSLYLRDYILLRGLANERILLDLIDNNYEYDDKDETADSTEEEAEKSPEHADNLTVRYIGPISSEPVVTIMLALAMLCLAWSLGESGP